MVGSLLRLYKKIGTDAKVWHLYRLIKYIETFSAASNCFGAFLQTELMESVIYSTFFWWGRQRNSADTLKWNLCKCIADIQISIGTCECNFLQCEFRGSFDTFDIILRVFRGEGTLFDDNADIVDHHGKHLQHNRRHGSRGADGPAHPAMHRKLADCCKR